MANGSFATISKLSPIHLRMALAHHPKLANAFQALAHTVLFGSAVSARDREIAIIRTAALARSEYAWGMHVSIYSASCGLTEAQLDDLTLKRSWAELAPGLWTGSERLVIRMADELYEHATVADETWAAMSRSWPREQVIELIFAATFYRLSSSFLNAAAVPLEAGARRFPDGIEQARVPA